MPNGNNGHIGTEKIQHQYTLTSQKMLKKLGIKGSWIDNVTVERYEFQEDGQTKEGKKIHITTTERLDV